MLARQQGRRHDDGDLQSGHDRCKGGAQGDLRLAETDIAAHQAVHRLAGREVGQRLVDGAILVVGLGERKARRELVGRAFRTVDDRRLPQFALGGDGDQLPGHRRDTVLDLRLARLPGRGSQPVENGGFGIAAEAGQHLHILRRYEERVAAVVGQAQAIVVRPGGRDGLQPFVAADAMLAMDNQIAFVQRR